MFDAVIAEVPGLDVFGSGPSEPAAPELPTVWDVLAGRVGPGPAAIRALAAVDPEGLDAQARADVVTAWEAQASWVAAQQQRALETMSHPEPVVRVDDPTDRGFAVVPERVAVEAARLALACSPGWAEQRIWFAHTLAARLPVTRGLLAAGRISAYQAGIAATESAMLSDPECTVFEERVYPRGQSQTAARFRRACRLVVAALHPEHLETAHTRARQHTDVTKWVDEAGMASLRLHAPAPVIEEIWQGCNNEAHAQARAAKRRGEPPVPIGERRVAVFTRWARTHDTNGTKGTEGRDGTEGTEGLPVAGTHAAPEPLNPLGLPTGPAPKIQVGVIIDLDVLLGARDGPAILQGHGPIPASLARELAADGSWRRVVLEPVEGWLLDYGRARYEPSAKLRDHLLGLGQDCRAPYCNARPRQTDHGTDWANGGTTSASNLNGMCTHTHFLKTVDNFQVTNHPDHSLTWTTPAGNSYTKPPDDLRITNYGKKPTQVSPG
jgi:hypothetical protein